MGARLEFVVCRLRKDWPLAWLIAFLCLGTLAVASPARADDLSDCANGIDDGAAADLVVKACSNVITGAA